MIYVLNECNINDVFYDLSLHKAKKLKKSQ